MYATVSNSLLPRLMSPVPDPRAIAVGALSQVWQGWLMYMFPPFSLPNRVFSRSHSDGRDVSHSPWWPNQPCFPHLLRLCVEHPLILPYRRDLLSQQNQKYISDEMSYHLHAWRLSCDTIRQQGFSDEVSRLTAAPRRPLTDRMYDDRWLRFVRWLQGKVLIHLIPQPLE